MHRFGLKTVFSKLFASVMLTLVLFTAAMITLTHLVHDNSSDTKWQILAQQIVNQIDPFVDELDNAIISNQRLQARFMLAVIKKSLDIFDESLSAKMGLYDRDGHLLIQTDDSDFPKILPEDPTWMSRMLPTLFGPAQNNVQAVGDRGYILLYEPRNPPKPSELSAVLNLFTGTLALLIIMTVVLWWIARSMTWRLNQMSQQMKQLGEGDFSVRVPARGTDEIASLAKGFNQAAQKIEQLINANSLLLAHASHELRTPITRIRLQIEMMEMLSEGLNSTAQDKFQKRAQAIKRDLTGLNDLVESILLVSRLDAGQAAEKNERFDLLNVVSQECYHYSEATLFGQSVTVEGQPKLLIHLIRNLLNNALIHGSPPVEVHVYGVMNESDALTPPEDLTLLTHTSSVNEEEDKVKTNSGHEGSNSDKQGKAPKTTQTTVLTPLLNNTATQSVNDTNLNKQGETLSYDPLTYDTRSYNAAIKCDLTHQTFSQATVSNSHKFLSPKNILNQGGLTQKSSTELSKLNSDDKPETTHLLSVTKQDLKTAKSKATKTNDTGFTKRLRRSKPEVKPIPKFAVLSVIDQGSGIPLNKRQEIFSPFVRLQQKNKGSGLGLSLVSQIVEAHQGHIQTDTYEGRTRFIVILPTAGTPSNKE